MIERNIALLMIFPIVLLVLLVTIIVKRRPKKALISVESEVISIFEREKEIAANKKPHLKKVKIKSMFSLPNIVYIYKQQEGYLGTGIMNYRFCLDRPAVYVLNYSREKQDVFTWYDLSSETDIVLLLNQVTQYAKNYFGNT